MTWRTVGADKTITTWTEADVYHGTLVRRACTHVGGAMDVAHTQPDSRRTSRQCRLLEGAHVRSKSWSS